MFVIIGLAIVFGSIITGYLMHHGELAVLWQVNEFVRQPNQSHMDWEWHGEPADKWPCVGSDRH